MLCRDGRGSRGGNKRLEEKACSPTKAQFVEDFCETDWDEKTTLGTFPWEKQKGREGQREYLGLSNICNRLSLFIPAIK